MIHVFVKGKDDFGKKKINDLESKFSHFNRKSQVFDIHIYYYPNTPSIGIYQVIKVNGDDHLYSGTMKNLMGKKDIFRFIQVLKDEGLVEFVESIEKIVYYLQSTYNPELLIEAKI